MLPRALRLSRQGFEGAKGLSRASTPHFSISYGPASPEGGSAVIVPKKVVKGAVARHFLKRRVRAILKPWSRPDRVLIISARTGVDTLSYSDMEHELSTALSDILPGQI